MSEEAKAKLKRLEQLGNKELLEKAWKEISLLCGSDGPPKRWSMTVPVDADRDSDILFAEVLGRFTKLEAEIEVLRGGIERLEFLSHLTQGIPTTPNDRLDLIGEEADALLKGGK